MEEVGKRQREFFFVILFRLESFLFGVLLQKQFRKEVKVKKFFCEVFYGQTFLKRGLCFFSIVQVCSYLRFVSIKIETVNLFYRSFWNLGFFLEIEWFEIDGFFLEGLFFVVLCLLIGEVKAGVSFTFLGFFFWGERGVMGMR